MTVQSITSIEANDLSVNSFRQGYQMGREAGLAEAQVQIDCANLLADHWYYIANNPGSVEAERKYNLSFVELRERRAEREALRQQWDAEEQAMFDRARGMIDAGKTDREVALATGLFFPIVANLRSGAL